jgi:hypothetical protein
MTTPRKRSILRSSNGEAIPIIQLNDSHDITSGAQSNVINGTLVRICATSGAIRFLIGVDPTALTTSNFLADQQEIYQPCAEGDKVSVLGGPANISTCGI